MTPLPLSVAVALLLAVSATYVRAAPGTSTVECTSLGVVASPPERTVASASAPSIEELVAEAVERQTRSSDRWNIFLTAFVGLLFVLVTGWARKSIETLRQSKKSALRQIDGLERALERIAAETKELKGQLQTCETMADKVRDIEELVQDTTQRVEVANIRAQFLSLDPDERLRAIEKASNKRNPRLIPLLKDALREPCEPVVLCEALHGLRWLAQHSLADDGDLVTLVWTASHHSATNVRRKSIECMAAIGSDYPLFQSRLREMARSDPELKDEASRTLRDGVAISSESRPQRRAK